MLVKEDCHSGPRYMYNIAYNTKNVLFPRYVVLVLRGMSGQKHTSKPVKEMPALNCHLCKNTEMLLICCINIGPVPYIRRKHA